MYLLNFTSCLTDQENSPSNLRGKQAGGRGRGTGLALTLGLSNQPVKKGAGRGRAASQGTTWRPSGENHAGVSDDSGKTYTAHTHTHAHAHTAHSTQHTHSHVFT